MDRMYVIDLDVASVGVIRLLKESKEGNDPFGSGRVGRKNGM